MWSTCSIDTGHACTQAPQVTQSQTDSSGTASGRERRLALPEDVCAQSHDDELRRERLAGRERRAGVLAAAALGAREGVEHLFPGQIGGRAGAEPEVLLALPFLGSKRSGSSRPRAAVRPNQTLIAAVAMCRCLECGR